MTKSFAEGMYNKIMSHDPNSSRSVAQMNEIVLNEHSRVFERIKHTLVRKNL